MPENGCRQDFSARDVSSRSFSVQGTIQTISGLSLKRQRLFLNRLQFSCVLILLNLQVALQYKFHVLGCSNFLCLWNGHTVKTGDEKEIIATCLFERRRVKIQDDQILPWKDTVAGAVPHAMLLVRMDSLNPLNYSSVLSSVLLHMQQSLWATLRNHGNILSSGFHNLIAETDTKLMDSTQKVTLLTLP